MILSVILIVVLAAFNTVFFQLNTVSELSQAQWITYGFINFGLVCPFIVSLLPMNKSDIKAGVVSTAIVYGVLELIVGIVLLAFHFKDTAWTLSIQVVMLAVAFVVCLSVYSIERRKNL